MKYDPATWLPLTSGLTLLGLIGSWFVWRRRGAAAGLRLVAWSLLPVAAYLTRTIKLLWQIGSAITAWAASFVFSPTVWLGVIVGGVAGLLFVISGALRRRKPGKQVSAQPAARAAGAGKGAAASLAAGKDKPAKAPDGKRGPAEEDGLGDVRDILRRRGIR